MRRGQLLPVLVALLLLALPKLPVYAAYTPSFDDVYYMGRGADALEQPSLLLTRDYTGRSHPLWIALLALSFSATGVSWWPWLLASLLAHLASAWALLRLAGRLAIPAPGPVVAGVAFVCFAAPSRVFGSAVHVSRTLALCCALLALLALARHLERPRSLYAVAYLGLLGLGLAIFEDPVPTPLVGLLLAWALRRPPPRALVVHVTALAISGLLVFHSLGGAAREGYQLGLGAHLPRQLLALPRELLTSLLLLHRDLAPAPLRFGLGLTLLGLGGWALWPARRQLLASLRTRSPLFALGWLLLATLPYLARPSAGVWYSRYLYSLGPPLALALGALAGPLWAALGGRRRAALLAAGLLVLATNLVTLEHMLRKIQHQHAGVVPAERIEPAFRLARLLNRTRLSRGQDVGVLDAPLTPGELERVCSRWVHSQPRCVPVPGPAQATALVDWSSGRPRWQAQP